MGKEYDAKRNYYADLELPSTCTVDDVKKQYRKLALLYHPDRNAGKESEYIPKFQAIQSAHEILGDPTKKTLYDADRRKILFAPQTVFPVPRGQKPRGNPYQASSNFPPPPRRTQPGEFKRPPGQQPRPQPDGAGRFSGFGGAPPPPPPPQRSDPARDRANIFQRHMDAQARARANAADPGPATPNEQPQRPAPPPRADTKYPTEESTRFGQPRPSTFDTDSADSRRSAWEAVYGTKAPQPGVKRSETTRTPRKQGFDPNAPGSDERQASGHYAHRHRSEDFGQSPYANAKHPRRPNINPTKPNRDPTEDDADVPFSEANRHRTPYTSFIGEKTNLRRSKSSRDTSTMEGGTSFRPHSTSPHSNGRAEANTFDFNSTESEAGTSASDSSDGGSAFSRQPNFHRPDGERPKKVPSPPSRRFEKQNGKATRPDGFSEAPAGEHIFSYNPSTNPAFSPPSKPSGKSRSAENINLKFAQPWNGVFQGSPSTNAPPPLTRKSTNERQRNGKSRTTFGYPSPLGKLPDPMPPPPPGPAPNISATTSPTSQFAKEQHEAAFKNFEWSAMPPPPPPLQTSADNQHQPAGVSSQDPSPREARHPEPPAVTVEDEMDIDDSPPVRPSVPSTHEATAMPPPPKPIRMVSVPPSQWHQQQAGNAHHIRAASSGQAQSRTSGLKTNFDDFGHVEPFARSANGGLEDLSDVSMNLPFKSRASNFVPTQTESPQALDLPTVPLPPPIPQNLTKQTWQGYSSAFAIYLQRFHTFNAQVLRHFTQREALVEGKMSQGMGWLQATGDVSGNSGPNGPTGFAAYLRELREDARIREVWSLGSDRHLRAVESFDGMREKVRQLVNGGGLIER